MCSDIEQNDFRKRGLWGQTLVSTPGGHSGKRICPGENGTSKKKHASHGLQGPASQQACKVLTKTHLSYMGFLFCPVNSRPYTKVPSGL